MQEHGEDPVNSRFSSAEEKVRATGTAGECDLGQMALQEPLLTLQAKDAYLRVLTTAIEQSPITIMITDPAGTIQYVNPRFQQDTGFTREDAIGENPRILKSGAQTVEFYQDLWETITSGREWTGVFHNRRKDGILFWESATIAPVRDANGSITHFIALKRDITQQKASEEALASSEMRLRSIIDSMLGGLLTFAPDGTIETLNPAAERIFGYSSEELVGSTLTKLLPASSQRSVERFLRQAHATAIGDITEWEGRRKDGTEFPFELSLFEIETTQGKRFAGNFRDISERRELDRIKREFLSMVSHELRTPLTSIRGSLGLLKSGIVGELPPKAAELTEIALKNSERLVLLINDLLDLEKLESGKMEFRFEDVDVLSLAHQSIEANRGYGEQFGVTYRMNSSDGSLVVRADPDRLQQVMANLLSNAAKFSPRDSVVDILVTGRDTMARVSVHNCGHGISEEFKTRIFQRFAQADSSDQRKKGGTGLGLNICKIIIEAMGGTIAFESTAFEGTTFYFDLPLLRRPHAEQGSEIVAKAAASSPSPDSPHSGPVGAQHDPP